MYKRRHATYVKKPNAKEVKVSIMFSKKKIFDNKLIVYVFKQYLYLARLGEINTILEKFSCEATLFITWFENSELFENYDPGTCEWNTKKLWDPQLVLLYFSII